MEGDSLPIEAAIRGNESSPARPPLFLLILRGGESGGADERGSVAYYSLVYTLLACCIFYVIC